jgi:hypothetical protein
MTQDPSPLLRHGFFTAAMKAYDDALQSLPRNPSDEICDLLAARIMELAETGERDPIKLRNHALRGRLALLNTSAPSNAALPAPSPADIARGG